MSKFSDMTYYEVLDVSIDATPSQIRQAYQDVLSMYQDDLLVSDSFFTGKEKESIIGRIEKAYSVLSNQNQRIMYNQSFVPPQIEPDFSGIHQDDDTKVVPMFTPPDKSPDKSGLLSRVQAAAKTDPVKTIIANVNSSETISGESFKMLREAFGIRHENIFEITRIRISVLKSIENNRFKELPPRVYLKSFLKAFSEILQLDPETAVVGFISYMDENDT